MNFLRGQDRALVSQGLWRPEPNESCLSLTVATGTKRKWGTYHQRLSDLPMAMTERIRSTMPCKQRE